jgi:hypothetical protein
MGLLDKAKGMISGREDKAKQGIDKAADMADDRTGGKYTERIDQGGDMAKDRIDDLGAE